MRKIIAPALLVVALVSFTVWASSEAASAPDIVVTVQGDPAADGCGVNGCSLREAVSQANSQAGVQTIGIGPHFTVQLEQGPLTVTGDMAIAGGDSSVITSDGQRIFELTASGDLTLAKVTVRGADVGSGCGGAIHNAGRLTLTDMTLEDNHISGTGAGLCNEGTAELSGAEVWDNHAEHGPGGAIYNSGVMTIDASRIETNTVTGVDGGGDGGGIANAEGGELTITGTVITENTASSPACDDCSSGGGITNDGTLTMKYSTISYNAADNAAALETGGSSNVERSTFSHNNAGSISIGHEGHLTLYASTVSSNLAAAFPKIGSGGIQNNGGLVIIASTIADNTNTWVQYGGLYNSNSGGSSLQATLLARNGAENCHTGGNLTSQGKNVVDDDTCDMGGTDQVVADAKVGQLADNGGFTETHALLSGSPAIDTGQGYFCTTDQRFAPRPVGPQCDVGSFEFGGVPPTPTAAPTASPVPVAYPLGDTGCNDRVDLPDITAELELVAGVAAPDDCGRTTIPCTQIGDLCYPWWTDTDCNATVDAKDALWIVLSLAGTPADNTPCPAVGSYPVG